jgi:hypothetical protein
LAFLRRRGPRVDRDQKITDLDGCQHAVGEEFYGLPYLREPSRAAASRIPKDG